MVMSPGDTTPPPTGHASSTDKLHYCKIMYRSGLEPQEYSGKSIRHIQDTNKLKNSDENRAIFKIIIVSVNQATK